MGSFVEAIGTALADAGVSVVAVADASSDGGGSEEYKLSVGTFNQGATRGCGFGDAVAICENCGCTVVCIGNATDAADMDVSAGAAGVATAAICANAGGDGGGGLNFSGAAADISSTEEVDGGGGFGFTGRF